MNIYTLWLLFAASICTQVFEATAYVPSGDACQNVPAYCCTSAGNAGGINQAPGGGMYGNDPYGSAQAGGNSAPYGSDPYGSAQAGGNYAPYGSDPYGGAYGGNSGPYSSDPYGGAQMGADSGPYGGGAGGDYGGGSLEASAYASAAIQGGDPNSAAALAGIVTSGSSSVSGVAIQG